MPSSVTIPIGTPIALAAATSATAPLDRSHPGRSATPSAFRATAHRSAANTLRSCGRVGSSSQQPADSPGFRTSKPAALSRLAAASNAAAL